MCPEGEGIAPESLMLQESQRLSRMIGSMTSRYLRTIYVQYVVKREQTVV